MNDIETLYRRHASSVFRFALGLCGDRVAAEDIVSETFVRLLTRAPRIETRTALAYLLAIARNTYLNGRRRRRREVPLTEDIAAPENDPAGRLDDRDHLAAALSALAVLPEGERSALLLRVDHELSYEEIAAALGTTAGAAKVRVHRARLRLADRLESQGRTR
ncbi:MAG: RNA polymerase sigma factor [Candidatus Krumholzibacteriota bacterium]|nr:RNA polymerase sigma factor [Candidatus Krumholzibacteriota bacterium]